MHNFQKIIGAISSGKAEWLVEKSAAFTMSKPLWFPFPYINILSIISSILYGIYSGFWIQGILGGVLAYLTISLTPPFITKTTKSNFWLLPIILIGSIYTIFIIEQGVLVFIPALLVFISQKLNIFYSTQMVLSYLHKNLEFAERSWNGHSVAVFFNEKIFWKHREDELIESIDSTGEKYEDTAIHNLSSTALVTNATSSGIQFLFIFGIIGFGIYGGQGNMLGWIISGLLLIGLILYTKKSNKKIKQIIETKELQYFTIPFWRFFLMQFLTGGLYLAYWTGKNKELILRNNYKWHNVCGIFGDAIFKSLLARHIKSKLLITLLSLLLGLWLIVPLLISFYILFVQKNVHGFGFFQITNVFGWLEKIGDMDFKYALLLIAIVILCIIFYFFPFLLAQYFAKKYHKKSGIPQYTAKFGVFEICMYIVGIMMIYFTINGDLEGTESSAGITGSSQVMDQKEEIIWKEYKSSTGSFQVMTPGIIEYSRQEDKENNTDEIIDVYKSSIKNTDIVLMITHDQLDKEFSLKGISVKEIYKSLMKSYTVSEELSYNEIEGEAHYIAKITHEKQPLYIKGRIIKKNNNEAYNVFSIYTDISSKQLANKFIDSFKFIGQK